MQTTIHKYTSKFAHSWICVCEWIDCWTCVCKPWIPMDLLVPIWRLSFQICSAQCTFVNLILWIVIVHIQIVFCEYNLGYGFVNCCLQIWICLCICESYLEKKTPYLCAEWEVCANATGIYRNSYYYCVALRWERWK